MNQLLKQKVGELAIENYSFLEVFQNYNIDFFCRGDLTLKEAIKNAKIEDEVLLNTLSEIKGKHYYGVRINDWPLDLLADYIQKTHHRFTDQTLVQIKTTVNDYLTKENHKQEIVIAFKEQLELLAKELGGHMKKEELILFPFIRKMVATRGKMEEPKFKTVENPIEMMIHEHDNAFQLLKNIRELLNDYSLKDLNSTQMKRIVLLMNDLDHDLTLHLHLENNILFPKAITFEKNKLNL